MKKRYKVLSLLLLIALLGTCFPATRVEAGARTIAITGKTFESDGDWNNLRNQVTVDEEKLIFPVDSTEKTGMICKTVIRGDKYFNALASAECNLKLTKLPAGQSFALCFGLAGIEASLGNTAGEGHLAAFEADANAAAGAGLLTLVTATCGLAVAGCMAAALALGNMSGAHCGRKFIEFHL